jgi:hypothetical protein
MFRSMHERGATVSPASAIFDRSAAEGLRASDWNLESKGLARGIGVIHSS